MKQKTSWEKVGRWYGKATQGKGHYYHEHVVIPKTISLLALQPEIRLLDLACGSGVLGRAIPKTQYYGLDVSPTLIAEAKKLDHSAIHTYAIADVTKQLTAPNDFTHAAIILALQNIKEPFLAIQNAARHLTHHGKLVIVVNHPAFRIPRQSSWGIDEQNKLQYRRINRYMSPLEIPITMHPGESKSTVTWSYHQPLSIYAGMLKTNGFLIETMEEWTSDKQSAGSTGKMENRSRSEFPLFLAISAIKRPFA